MIKNFFGNKKRLLIIVGAVVAVGIAVALICFLCLHPKEQ